MTSSISCPDCEAANSARRRICHACGGPLPTEAATKALLQRQAELATAAAEAYIEADPELRRRDNETQEQYTNRLRARCHALTRSVHQRNRTFTARNAGAGRDQPSAVGRAQRREAEDHAVKVLRSLRRAGFDVSGAL